MDRQTRNPDGGGRDGPPAAVGSGGHAQGAPASQAPVTSVPGRSPLAYQSAMWFTPARETTSPLR